MSGSAALEVFAAQTARDVTDPQTRVSAMERANARRRASGRPAEYRIDPLGSGSDYTVFQHHLGIPSLNIGFGGEGGGGVYHSNYDSYDHFVRFIDPDFQYVLATAKLGGRMMLRMANADTLPFRFEAMSRSVRGWTNEVVKLADDLREQTKKENELIRSGVLKLAADPARTFIAPEPKAEVPFLNFAPLLNAVGRLEAATAKVSAAKNVDEAALLRAEQQLTQADGLPRRPWFKHVLHAPGFYTGYGVKTLPGVREAIEQRQWQEAEQQIVRLAETLSGYARFLEQAIR